jgi:hypothetical protein
VELKINERVAHEERIEVKHTTAEIWSNELALARTALRVAEEHVQMIAAQMQHLAVEANCHDVLQDGDGCFWFSDGSMLEDGKPYTATDWQAVDGRKASVVAR